MQVDPTRITAFIHDEAECLDEGRYEDWLELFADNGIYWIPRTPDQADPNNEISLFYGTRSVLEVRVRRLRHPHVHSIAAPFRVSHVIGAVRISPATGPGGEVRVQSRFHVHEYHDGRERHFSGRYVHELVSTGDRLRIRLKRVELVNCDAMFEPIEIPI